MKTNGSLWMSQKSMMKHRIGMTKRQVDLPNCKKNTNMCHGQGWVLVWINLCSIIYFHTHVSLSTFSLSSQITSLISFVLMMGDTPWPSFHEFVPVKFNTLSRSYNYKQISALEPLHTSMVCFLTFDSRFTPLSPDQTISRNVQHHLIDLHLSDCTRVPWESLTLLVISLTLVIGIH